MKLLVVGTSGSTPALLDAAHALGVEASFDAAGGASPDEQYAGALVDLDGVPSESAEGVMRRFVELDVPVVCVGTRLPRATVLALLAEGASDVLSAPLHKRELILRLSAAVHRKLRIACIGGGTGLFVTLSGMKSVPRVLLSSVVTMSDDGGSSGRLRASFGVLPPGDVRRSLVALSNAPEIMNYIMQYRFDDGGELSGHSLGNLLLTALTSYTGGMPDAVKVLGDLLNVQGIIMCASEEASTLCARFTDGRVVRGESGIDRCEGRPAELRISSLWHEPSAATTTDVVASIAAADLVIIGPGDLYTSVLSGLVVDGVAESLRAARGKRLYVCNLMTKPGETHGYDVAAHVEAVVEALGADVLDYVLVSTTPLDPGAIRSYAEENQHPVALDAERVSRVTRAALISSDVGDHARLVRHDSSKLTEELLALLRRNWPSRVPHRA